MNPRSGWLVLVLVIAVLGAVGCARASQAPAHAVSAAKVEPVEGTTIKRLTLTERAVERLGIQSVAVRAAQNARNGSRIALPYAAVLYDAHGGTWTYTRPEPQVFLRQEIAVEYIEADEAFLSAGPSVGTAVVTVGAAELFGTEFDVGH
jgi:hypothetical protein